MSIPFLSCLSHSCLWARFDFIRVCCGVRVHDLDLDTKFQVCSILKHDGVFKIKKSQFKVSRVLQSVVYLPMPLPLRFVSEMTLRRLYLIKKKNAGTPSG